MSYDLLIYYNMQSPDIFEDSTEEILIELHNFLNK